MTEKTSQRVAHVAGKVLRHHRDKSLRALIERSPEIAERWLVQLAASALTQAPDRKPSLLRRLLRRPDQPFLESDEPKGGIN